MQILFSYRNRHHTMKDSGNCYGPFQGHPKAYLTGYFRISPPLQYTRIMASLLDIASGDDGHQLQLHELIQKWLWTKDSQFMLGMGNYTVNCNAFHWDISESFNDSCQESTESPMYVGMSVLCSQAIHYRRRRCLDEPGLSTCSDGICMLSHLKCGDETVSPDARCEQAGVVMSRINCALHCKTPHCSCTIGYFQCKSAGCVSYNKVCDCRKDCPYDSSDEDNCVNDECLDPHRIPNVLNEASLVVSNCKNMTPPPYIMNDLVPDCVGDPPLDETDSMSRLIQRHLYRPNSPHLSEELCPGNFTTCIKGFPMCYPR